MRGCCTQLPSESGTFPSCSATRLLAAGTAPTSVAPDVCVGACADNAALESLSSLPQRSVLDRKRWHTRDELRLAIVTWIERTYHRRRRHDRLGRLTPWGSTPSERRSRGPCSTSPRGQREQGQSR